MPSRKSPSEKIGRRSFLNGIFGLGILASIPSLPAKVFAISAPRLRRAKRSVANVLWSWGAGGSGRLANGGTTDVTTATSTGIAPITGIAAGAEHSLLLKSGTLWVSGRNNNGQLGDATTVNKSTPMQVGSAADWSVISAGEYHSVALKTNNTLWSFGLNTLGQLGDGTTTQKSSPIQIGSLSNWSKIAGGANHTLAIKTDGTLWAWGSNTQGQIGNSTHTSISSPIQITTDTTWTKIAAGGRHSLGIKSNGTLWAWGSNEMGQLGLVISTPIQSGSFTWTMVANRKDDSANTYDFAGGMGIRSDGTLWAWGYNENGQMGDGTLVNKESPVQIGTESDWAYVAVGPYSSYAIKTTGTLWAVGENGTGELGLGDRVDKSTFVQVGALSDWAKIASGDSHVVAVKTDGTLWSWGSSLSGSLGYGTASTKRSSPSQVGSAVNWSNVAAGGENSYAITTTGTIWGWGDALHSQVGNGASSGNVSTPVQIGTDTTWVSIAAGTRHAVGLKADGTMWTWGYNFNGELGLGNTTERSTPVQVASGHTWASIGASRLNTFAISSTGVLWATGYADAEWMFLGSGVTTRVSSFIQISGTNWSKVMGGTQGGMALKTDGTLYAWGRPLSGASAIPFFSPVQVGTSTLWAEVAAGDNHTTAIQSNGTIWQCGDALNGSIAMGMWVNAVPTKIGTVSIWSKVSARGRSNIALRTDGTAWSWGNNANGKLGLGDTTWRSTPTQIGTTNGWVEVAAGTAHMLGRKNT
ncbi:chromosome condensation regulator RCC1 [Bdellovibrio sp. HCB2-146]|uniref:RCC1 domain-containing protein n=1 Tax=Bdellovibrio sp. HCB2-146 TaxID=3394362 RepID=UPI0039BD82B1